MDFVPILSFDDYIEANIVLGRLQNEGINCWLKNENSALFVPMPIAGIRLMVTESQVERALDLIDSFKNNSAAE